MIKIIVGMVLAILLTGCEPSLENTKLRGKIVQKYQVPGHDYRLVKKDATVEYTWKYPKKMFTLDWRGRIYEVHILTDVYNAANLGDFYEFTLNDTYSTIEGNE